MARRSAEWTPHAEEDIEEQAVYLGSEGGLAVAARFLVAAERAARRLAEVPELGAARPFRNSELAGVRMWSVPEFPNHLIFHRASERGVEIVRVLIAHEIGQAFSVRRNSRSPRADTLDGGRPAN